LCAKFQQVIKKTKEVMNCKYWKNGCHELVSRTINRIQDILAYRRHRTRLQRVKAELGPAAVDMTRRYIRKATCAADKPRTSGVASSSDGSTPPIQNAYRTSTSNAVHYKHVVVDELLNDGFELV